MRDRGNTYRCVRGGASWWSLALMLLHSGNASARGKRGVDPQIAGLQVALSAQRYYAGAIDAIPGTATVSAVRSFQRRHGLPLTGSAGQATQTALGKLGRPLFGVRTIKLGMAGWDVSVLQFLLTLNGFGVGTLDGHFGPRTRAAVVAFQRQSQLVPDSVVGPATQTALCPRRDCESIPSSRAPAGATYRVHPGDTLTAIASRTGTTVAALAEVNAITRTRSCSWADACASPASASRPPGRTRTSRLLPCGQSSSEPR